MNNKLSGLSREQLEQLLNLKLQQSKSAGSPAQSIDNTPQQPIAENGYSKVGSFLRSAADSGTLGFGPKIVGGALAPILKLTRPDLFGEKPFSEIYQEARDTTRRQNMESAQENPVSSLLGGLAGGAALPFPAKSLKQGAGLGALYGGTYGIGSSDEGELGSINADNVLSGLSGAGSGAGLGFLATLGGNAFSKRKPPAEEIVERLNLSKQFDIPATYGELTQNPQELLREEAALKGRLGSGNQKKLADLQNVKKENTNVAATNLRNELGNGEIQNKGEAAREAVTNLQNRALEERQGYKQVYDEAKKDVQTISKDNFTDFSKDLEESLLDDVITRDNTPKAFGEIDALKSIFNNPKNKEINIKQVEAWRQGLNQSYKSALNAGDEKTGFALNKVRRQFDDFLDNSIEKALENGDQNALQQFKNARALTAEWYKKYGSGNSKSFGKKFVEDLVDRARVGDDSLTDEMIVNKIFGSSELGFKPESADIVKELKKLMPKEDFDKIKLEAAQKILSPLISENPSAAKYKTGLKKLINSNPTLVKELFGKEEIKQLNDLGKITDSIFTRQKSSINPSGTAEVVIDYLDRRTGGKFLKNLFNKIQTDQSKIENRILKGEKEIKEPSVLFKTLPASGRLPSEKDPDSNNNQEKDLENFKATPANSLSNLSREQLQKLLEFKNQKTTNGDLLNKISSVESGNNPNARSNSSSASGLFQFTDGTWKEVVKKYGREYGITLQDKNNKEAQKIMASKLLEDNRNALKNDLERNPTNGELYLAHFLGAKGAAKLIRSDPNAPAARIFPAEARANKPIFFKNSKPRTIKEVYNVITSKV